MMGRRGADAAVRSWPAARFRLTAIIVSAPMGAPVVKRACWIDPVTCSPAAGLGGGLWLWLFLVAAGLCRRAGRGQAGAPAAPRRQARARTNELEAGKRRSMIGSEEQPPCGLAYAKVAGLVSRSRVVVGVVSHAPIRRLPDGGSHMTVASGDRAAQSGHRARRGRLMRKRERARGLATSRLAGRTVAAGVGEQVVGAGEELAGDRRGGDLLAAAAGDGLIPGGELG